MYTGKRIKQLSFILALATCLSVLLPGAVLADTCTQHVYEETVLIPATETADGSVALVCSVCGDTVTETVPRIASVALRARTVSFKDKAQVPEIIAKDANGNLISNEYYTVSMTTEAGDPVPFGKAIGKYKVTVTFTGRYSGEGTYSFRIGPQEVENISASSSGCKVTLTYDKVPNAKGYQIYYSKSKHGPYTKLGTTSKTTYTTKKLTKGAVYYFKVRAYKGTVSGNVHGNFSAIRKVTIK